VRNSGSFASINSGVRDVYSAKDMYSSILNLSSNSKSMYIDEFTDVISAMSHDMMKLIDVITKHIHALRRDHIPGGSRLTTKADSSELLIVAIHAGLSENTDITPVVTSIQISSNIRTYLKNDRDLPSLFRVLSTCDDTEEMIKNVFAESDFAKNYDSYKDRINKLRTYHVLAE
jgi:hypothetical protein